MKGNLISFRFFIQRQRRVWWWIILVALPIQFIIFKLQYPFPNFRGDSRAYIAAASMRTYATEWPVGYSLFLRIIHFFSHSDLLLVAIQYLILEFSALIFIFTIKYFIKPGKVVFGILFAFAVVNPMFLHLSNYIMSDCLFIALSLLWITQLLWIIYRPSKLQFISHALLLLCLFTVRYNALFYPFVSAVAILLSRERWEIKGAFILFSAIVIRLFVMFTEKKFEELTGVGQFSPFGGWQLANNALYIYGDIPLSERTEIPDRFKQLDSVVQHSFTVARQKHIRLSPFIKDYYIWDGTSPLMQYLNLKWRGDTTTDMFIKWASVGPLYSDYGGYLARKYSGEYFSHFIYPNMGNFFFPFIADLYYYNQGNDYLQYWEKTWFDYKGTNMVPAPRDYRIYVLEPYTRIVALFNIVFCISILSYLVLNEFRKMSRSFNCFIVVAVAFWLCNFFFSSMASTIELRYQIFQLFLNFTLSLVLIEVCIKLAKYGSPAGANLVREAV